MSRKRNDPFFDFHDYTMRMKMNVEDYKNLLKFAVESLEATISTMGDDGDLNSVDDHVVYDLKNWLHAELKHDQIKVLKDLQAGGLEDSEKRTFKVLDIISGIPNILEALNLKINAKPMACRLLVSDDGCPTWFSASA
ncbi:Pectinesterase [Quillaja saponaria]|uniref:Pectinesterase n=1 Tax=Quillaja saponaria TaxID=32244 RepID=A0AAD7LNW1_QUISA|nr:Pectinesterase [Quillaja saponaria]